MDEIYKGVVEPYQSMPYDIGYQKNNLAELQVLIYNDRYWVDEIDLLPEKKLVRFPLGLLNGQYLSRRF